MVVIHYYITLIVLLAVIPSEVEGSLIFVKNNEIPRRHFVAFGMTVLFIVTMRIFGGAQDDEIAYSKPLPNMLSIVSMAPRSVWKPWVRA